LFVTDCQSKLGFILGTEFDEYEKSLLLLKQAVKTDSEILDKKNPYISLHWNNLACVYGMMGSDEKALHLFEKALQFDLDNFGENYPSVGVRQYNLSQIYLFIDFKKAFVLGEKSVQNGLINLGDGHPDLAMRQCLLGILYYFKGKPFKAKALIKHSYKVLNDSTGLEHPSLVEMRSILKFVINNGFFIKILAFLFSFIAKFFLRFFGEKGGAFTKGLKNDKFIESSDFFEFGKRIRNFINERNKGNKLYYSAQYEEAQNIYQDNLKTALEIYFKCSEQVITCQKNLLYTYQALGKFTESLELAEQILNSELIFFDDYHYSVAKTKRSLAYLYYKTENYEKSLEMTNDVLFIYSKILHPNQLDINSMVDQKQYLESVIADMAIDLIDEEEATF
jgi:tetratricopeptide (TPR) repeat protein